MITDVKAAGIRVSATSSDVEVALLTGGFDRPYAFGLIMALASKGVKIEVIGSEELDEPAIRAVPALRFFKDPA